MTFIGLFRPIDGSIIHQPKSEENQGTAGIEEGENELMTFLTHDVMYDCEERYYSRQRRDSQHPAIRFLCLYACFKEFM